MRPRSVSRCVTILPMPDELTNLLPLERARAISREYHFRLGVVALSFASLLLLSAAILLIPTYVFLVGGANAKEAQLAHIKSALSASDETALSARLTALSNDAKALIALRDKPAVSKLMSAALAVSRPGIVLSSFTYAPPTGKNPATFALSGVAATRDALRNYQLALEGAPIASAASVPVSAYAKDVNIAFTVTLVLAP